MLSLALASLLFSQQALPPSKPAPVGAPPLKARIFIIEYPIYISPHVDQYTTCLRSQEVRIGSGRTFEAEYRNAVPLCAKIEKKTKKAAFDRLAEKPKYAMSMDELNTLFDNIKTVHIDRGRVLDGYMDRGLESDPYAQQVGKAEETQVNLDKPAVETVTQ
ncbi:hypothetical protein [Pontixanthobacter sp. CEM42]|uniref:hypothetical protein n=1 Tax=Pontixanthobacter sp. CEM42 TaxID=2792077 RepID=UPI001ADEEA61|nr:hypothetical protein [Pontixanthobacter sp. CEM42]